MRRFARQKRSNTGTRVFHDLDRDEVRGPVRAFAEAMQRTRRYLALVDDSGVGRLRL